MKNGKYQFNGRLLGAAHLWNQQRAKKAMEQGISPVVIDNTNVKFDHFQNYIKVAKENGYDVKYAEPNTKWKFDVNTLAEKKIAMGFQKNQFKECWTIGNQLKIFEKEVFGHII